MTDFTTSCERFLATARQHLFACNLGTVDQTHLPDTQSADRCGDTENRDSAGT